MRLSSRLMIKITALALIFLVVLFLLPELSLGKSLRNNGKYAPPPPVVFPGDEEDETQSSGSQGLRGTGGKPSSTETSSSSGYYQRKRERATSGVGGSNYLRAEPVEGGVVFTPIGYLISPQGSHQGWLLWWLSESLGGPDTLHSILSAHLSRGAYYSACSSQRLEIKGDSITNYFFLAPVHNSLENRNVAEDIKGFAFQPVFFGSYYVNGDKRTRKSVWSCDSIDSESISLNLEIPGYSVGSQNTYSYYFEAPLSCDLVSPDLVPLPFDFNSLKLREKGEVAVLIPHLSNLSVEIVGKLGSPILLSSKENLNCQVGDANVRIFYTLRELAKASEREGLITRDAIKILDGPLGVPLKGEYSLEDILEKTLKELESNPQYLEYATPQVLFSALIGPYCGNVDLRSYFLREKRGAFSSPLRKGYLDTCDMGYLPSDPSDYKRGKIFQGFYKFRMWTYMGAGDKRRPRLIALKAPLLQLPPEVISLKRGSIPARSSDVIDDTLRSLGKNRRLEKENVNPKPLYEPKNITPSLLFTLPGNLAVRIIDLSLFNPSKTKSFIKLKLDANDPILSKITPDTKIEMTFDKKYVTKLLNTYTSLDEAYPSPEWRRYDLILQRVKELGDRYEYKAVILNRWLTLKELASAIESGNLKLRTSDLLVHPLYAQLLQKHFPEVSAEDYDLTFEFDPSSAYSGKTYEFNLENIFESGKGAEVGLEVPPGIYHVRIRGRDIDTRFKLVLPLYDVSDMKVYLTPSRSALLRWFFGQMLIPLLWALLILILGILALILLRRRKIILVDKPEKVLLIPFSKRYSLLDTSGGNLLERIKNFIASKLRLPRGQEVIARFGNYLILDKIATGGMGTVFKAIDSKTKEVVALKVIHPHLVENEEVLDKFHREAEVLKVLHHPNIVRMIDAGVINGQPYIAYEFIDGKDLRTILEEKGKLPLSIAMKIFLQICEALDYAHQKGIIHRDIKPQNIMIMKDYFVKLTDFGIAKVIGESTGTTNEQVGTPLYASPEQLAGKPVDARSDIYSLGIVMFQVLTGHFPYDVADNVFSAIAAHIAQEPHRMKTLDKSALSQYVPYEVERIIMKMLEKDPDRRYQSVEELLIDLRNFLKRIKGA